MYGCLRQRDGSILDVEYTTGISEYLLNGLNIGYCVATLHFFLIGEVPSGPVSAVCLYFHKLDA